MLSRHRMINAWSFPSVIKTDQWFELKCLQTPKRSSADQTNPPKHKQTNKQQQPKNKEHVHQQMTNGMLRPYPCSPNREHKWVLKFTSPTLMSNNNKKNTFILYTLHCQINYCELIDYPYPWVSFMWRILHENITQQSTKQLHFLIYLCTQITNEITAHDSCPCSVATISDSSKGTFKYLTQFKWTVDLK